MEDILKSKTKCSIFVFNNIWRSRYEKMEYDHEENDSFAFCCNADISDDAGTGAGAGTE